MKIKVLQGFIDIGGQANRYAEAIRAQGHYSESWFYERTLRNEPYDRLLNLNNDGFYGGRFRKLGYLKDALLKFNIWHIHKGFSMFHKAKDLLLAKKLGKKIIIHYRGREIRPEMGLDKLPDQIVEKVKRESEIADLIFVKDGQLAELISPYVSRPIVFPNIVRIDHFIPPTDVPSDYYETNRKLRIVHAPSNPKYKGTEYVRLAIKHLRDRVDYSELTGVSHKEVLHAYWGADIVIDQLLTGTYGNAALESMALGRCVVNFLNPTFTKYEPATPPIVHTTIESLTEKLDLLDRSRDEIWSYGTRGKAFIKDNHTSQSIGAKLIASYEGL